MKPSLRYYGDPILRQKALPVEEINDEIRALVAEMVAIMAAHNGWGLAATQVGVALRLFITPVDFEDEEDKIHLCDPPKVYINPKLSNPSETQVEMNEGCLSIPNLSVPVVRPFSIDIEARNLEGETFKETLTGFPARNRMHENDHLNGVLTIDRVKGKRRTALEPELRRIKQKHSKK